MSRVYGKITITLLFFVVTIGGCAGGTNGGEHQLWPEIEPYETGYLEVSELHEIYYEQCGNREGKPVFVLHGGPGASTIPYYRRFFNPDRFHIVLHDQRGAGRSRPFLELRDNTTWHLVEDIEKLRNHLGLDKIILFGGSWGSTLALAYAETYPAHVSAMVLRGVFTATEKEFEHYYCGGSEYFFPEVNAGLKSALSALGDCVSPDSLYKVVLDGGAAEKKRYAIAWLEYEVGISNAEPAQFDGEKLWNESQMWKDIIMALGLIENYYMANRCFLEEGQLLRDAPRIANIPVTMINGRYDMICPPLFAYKLHQVLPKSKLVIAEMAGHSMRQKPIEKALLKAMTELE